MPHYWISKTELHLTPHRSLPRRGFAAFILATFTFITIPLYGLLGTAILWGLLPFLMLAVAAIWWALERSYRDLDITETLTMGPETTRLTHQKQNQSPLIWDCNTYWVKPEIHPKGGPVPFYITLKGNGKTVEMGSFLTEDERKQLYSELLDALKSVNA